MRRFGARRRRTVLAAVGAACVLLALTGGPARADDPTTSPSPTETSTSPSEDIPDVAPTFELTPPQGGPGDTLTATVTQFGDCLGEVRFIWDRQTLLGSAPLDSGSASVDLVVPETAEPGEYTVLAACSGVSTHRRVPLSQSFTVTAPVASLTLSPDTGAPGTQLTATLTNVRTCLGSTGSAEADTALRWGEATVVVPSESRIVNDGADLQIDFTVPPGSSAGPHTVTAACADTQPAATFTVTAVAAPTLNLEPRQGPPGSVVRVSGSGFACPEGDVELNWNDGSSAPQAAPAGSFSLSVTVPADAAAGTHRVRAACRNDPEISAERAFTVTSSVTIGERTPEVTSVQTDRPTTDRSETPPPSTESSTPWLLIAVIVAAALGAAELIRRRRPGRQPRPPWVQAVPRVDGCPATTVRESPERGEQTRALRVEILPGTTTLTITEGR